MIRILRKAPSPHSSNIYSPTSISARAHEPDRIRELETKSPQEHRSLNAHSRGIVGTGWCLLPGGRPRGLRAPESFDTNDLKALVSVQPPPLPSRAQGARDPITKQTSRASSPGLWLRCVAEGLECAALPRLPRCCGAGWWPVPGVAGVAGGGLIESYETLGGRRAAAVFSTTKP